MPGEPGHDNGAVLDVRWKVLIAGMCAQALTMSVARFAYTPLLPVMLEETSLDHAFGGWLATINYSGYLLGALICASISDLDLKDRLYRIGVVVSVLSTAMMGLADNAWLWAVSRFVAGLSSAAGMLLGTALILHWLLRRNYAGELGVQFAGVGLGIAVGAVSVKAMTPLMDWDGQWMAFSVLGAVLAVPALAWLPRPGRPVRSSAGPGQSQGHHDMRDRPPKMLPTAVLMVAYGCAGVGFVVFATFIVAIIDALPGLEGQGWLTFLIIGLAAAPGPWLWDRVARKLGHKGALVVAFALYLPAVTMPAIWQGMAAAFLAAALFGLTFLGIVSLVLTMAGHYYPSSPAKMMGRMTIAYGIAQIVAPAVTGHLAEGAGSYAPGLWLGAGAVAVGLVLVGVFWTLERSGRAA